MARFVFYAFGVLAIAALSLVLTLPASASGNAQLTSQFYDFAVGIVAVFFVYMFLKLVLRSI